MRGQSEETNSAYSHEYRFLSLAKEILANDILSREELFGEYGKLVDEYEALLTKLHQQNLPLGNLSPADILETESRLLTGISHEFRTPLTLIITALEEMHSTCTGNGLKQKLSMMLRNAQRLFFILKQVLALSESGRKELSLKTDRHDLITFLKGVIASFAVLAEENEIELILDADKENIILYFDPEKMSEVMCNLVMNALKYTPAGGQVKVSVHRSTPGAVVISVRDTGPGIPQAHLESIFNCYYHLNKPFEFQKKGFGIGLYLVKEYITLHRGTIHVNSSEGEGTEFVIQLPVENESLLPNEIETPPGSASKEKAGKEISTRHAFIMQLEKEDTLRPDAELPDTVTNPRGRNTVLLVEDNFDMRTFIRKLLEKYYIVVVAENGREGIDKAKKMIPDIIVSDIIMPEVDGIRLCRELKNNFDTSHIPIILLTARAADYEIIQGLQAGADDYIIKPFRVEVLLARIKNLVNLRRQLHEKMERRMRLQPEEISLSELENLFLDKIQELIEENLSDPGFGVDQLATALDISRPTLYRKIFALTGQAPQKFIQSYRLKRAFELLKSQFGNVTEVALKVGFSSSAYFTKCFKETFHRLPSDFQTF